MTASRATGYSGDTESDAAAYTDNAVAAETAYECRVSAVNDVDVSEQSDAGNVGTPASAWTWVSGCMPARPSTAAREVRM